MIAGLVVANSATAQTIKVHLDHWQNTGTVKDQPADWKWVDGNLHKTNSHYEEHDGVPTRFVMDNLPPNSLQRLTFRYRTTKKQAGVVKHAHDYIVGYTHRYKDLVKLGMAQRQSSSELPGS